MPLARRRLAKGGDASGCAQWLKQYIAAGARHIVLRFATLEKPSEMMGRVSDVLLPALRTSSAG